MYSTINKVESYFKKMGESVSFTSETAPSEADVLAWIEEETSWIDEQTQFQYSDVEREDILHYVGQQYLLTRFSPIDEVELYVNRGSEFEAPDWEQLQEYKDYSVEKEKGRIILTNKRIFTSRTFQPTRIAEFKHQNNKFKVVYKSGDVAPEWIKGICTRRVVYRILQSSVSYRTSDGVSTLSAGAITVVTPSDMGTGALRQLKLDIKEDEDKLTKRSGAYRYVNYLIN